MLKYNILCIYVQAVHQKDIQEDDIKIMNQRQRNSFVSGRNKHDLAAMIQFKTYLYTSCPLKSYTGRRLEKCEILGFGCLNTILNAFIYLV